MQLVGSTNQKEVNDIIRNLVLLILTVFSLSFAQMSWRPEPGRMLSIGIIGFLYGFSLLALLDNLLGNIPFDSKKKRR
jgi:hypothetical protein